MRAKIDAVGARANQINLEIGQITQLSTPELRAAWLVRARKWADAATILGVTRLLINQTGLSDANKADAIAAWKAFQDYAKPKGIKISAECRPFSSTVYGPPADYPNRARVIWGLMQECAEAAGGYTNVDFGRTGRFLNQQELHDAIKGTMKTNSGNIHVKMSPHWDLGTAVRFTESLGFKGLYTIEVDFDPAVRMVYNTVLANLWNRLAEGRHVYGPTGASRRSSSKKFCTNAMVWSDRGASRAAAGAATMTRRPPGATSNPPRARALAAQTAAFSATNASPLIVYDTVMMRSPAR